MEGSGLDARKLGLGSDSDCRNVLMNSKHLWSMAAAMVIAGGVMAATPVAKQSASLEPKVDQVFARWTEATPGCAVGVSVDGKNVLEKGYGMADLEHDAPNRGRYDLRGRLGLEAVHGRRGAVARRGRQAVAGRSGAQACSGAA